LPYLFNFLLRLGLSDKFLYAGDIERDLCRFLLSRGESTVSYKCNHR
jgi:hypothetical protein